MRIVLALVLALAACAGNPAYRPLGVERAAATSPLVAVQIVDLGGRPLAGVAVAVETEGSQVYGVTDAGGWAALRLPAAGRYQVGVYYGTTYAPLVVQVDSGEAVEARLALAPPADLVVPLSEAQPWDAPLISSNASPSPSFSTEADLRRLPR